MYTILENYLIKRENCIASDECSLQFSDLYCTFNTDYTIYIGERDSHLTQLKLNSCGIPCLYIYLDQPVFKLFGKL